MESTPGQKCFEDFEISTKGLKYYLNFLNKAVTGFERIDSNFETSSTVGKMLSNSITCYREIVHEGKIGMSQMAEYEYRKLTSSRENNKITNIYEEMIDVKDQSHSRKTFYN